MKGATGISFEGFIIEEFLNSPMTLRRCGQVTSAVKNQQLHSFCGCVLFFKQITCISLIWSVNDV
jgi:hypothetical protein